MLISFSFCLGLCPSASPGEANAAQLVVTSPDGRVRLEVQLAGSLSYSLFLDGSQVLRLGRLGLEGWRDGQRQDLSLGPDGRLEVASIERRAVDRIVRPSPALWNSRIDDRFREAYVRFRGGLSLTVRVADDAVALRFAFESPRVEPLTIARETFEYAFAPDAGPVRISSARVVCAPGRLDCFHDSFAHANAEHPLTVMATNEMTQMPAVVRVGPGAWLALSETGVFDYPGSWLIKRDGDRLALEAPGAPRRLRAMTDSTGTFEAVVERSGWLATDRPKINHAYPWRVIQVGRSLSELIGRDLPSRLADEPADRDAAWARPGFAFDPSLNETLPGAGAFDRPIEFAAHVGLPYVIVGKGWSPFALPAIARFARAKGVGLILWFSAWDLKHNLRRALDFATALGVKGIEVGLFKRDDVEAIRFQERLAMETERRRLLLTLHDSASPTGLQARYPHVLSIEGGLTHERDRSTAEVTPRQRMALAQVRSIAGPFDYGGGSFSNRQPDEFMPARVRVQSQGTRAAELALAMLIPSALQVLRGDADAYDADPAAFEWYRRLPTTWDETRVLEASLGRDYALARRSGTTWFLAAMSALEAPTLLQLDLSFLGVGRRFRLVGIADAPESDQNAEATARVEMVVEAGRRLSIRLARNGGYVARMEAMDAGLHRFR